MGRKSERDLIHLIAANDEGSAPDERKINATVLQLARLIGRQMARQDADRIEVAANDNVSGAG